MMKRDSLNWLQLVIALILVIAITTISHAQAVPFALKTLRSTQEVSNLQGNSLATVTMIYQPDCRWCKKQGKALEQAFEQCHTSMNIALVGVKGSARQLRKELKHYHKDIPAFIADGKFLRSIGGYQASPTTLIFDGKGELIAKNRGFIPKDKLANALALLTQGACLI